MITENYIGNSEKTGIYAIVNVKNKKIYIGSTKTAFSTRKNRHCNTLEKNTHYNEYLQNSYNKYGKDNFVFKVLYICEPDLCELEEAKFIKLYNSNNRKKGFNIASVREYRYNYKISKRHKKEASKRKLGVANTKDGHVEKERGINKSVKLYNLEGNLIKQYNSCKELSKEIKISRNTLSRLLSQGRYIYKNYIIAWPEDKIDTNKLVEIHEKFQKCKVDIYNLDLLLIKEGVYVNDAADFIGCKGAEIRMCYSERRSRIKNFLITKHKEKPSFRGKVKYSYIPIIQQDAEDNIIRIWKDINEVVKENPSYIRKYITRVLSNERNKYEGYKWKLQSDTTKEKIELG